MLKRHKNRLLEVIQASSLFDGRDFHIDETLDEQDLPIFVITYNDSPFRFTVLARSSSYHDLDYKHTLLAPGYPLSGFSLDEGWHNIDTVCEALKYWLDHELKEFVEDLNVPDLWAELAAGQSLGSDFQLEENDISQFSAEEKKQIRVAINCFRARFIDEFQVTQEHLELIDKRLHYLADALDRLNRFDWKGVLISTVFGISTALSLDIERGKVLWNIAKEVFSQAIRLLGY